MSLTTGPVVDKREKPVVEKSPMREVEEYKGTPPATADGKIPITYPINEKCNVKDKHYTGGKCLQSLMVARVMNAKFEWDNTHTGGQLIYDEEDIRQFKYCPIHGPRPAGPESW